MDICLGIFKSEGLGRKWRFCILHSSKQPAFMRFVQYIINVEKPKSRNPKIVSSDFLSYTST